MAYYLDFVFCVDATGSMASCLEGTKDFLKTFPEKILTKYECCDKTVDKMRIKVIVFRDFAINGAEALQETKFFEMPEEKEEYIAFLDGIVAKGESPLHGANALEAIACAIKSDWTTAKDAWRRHIVCVFTDTYAYPLQKRAKCPGYPEGMPADLAELGSWWEGTAMDFDGAFYKYGGRLIAFAPNAEPWVELTVWNRYWHTGSRAVEGLNEFDLTTVLDILVGDIG